MFWNQSNSFSLNWGGFLISPFHRFSPPLQHSSISKRCMWGLQAIRTAFIHSLLFFQKRKWKCSNTERRLNQCWNQQELPHTVWVSLVAPAVCTMKQTLCGLSHIRPRPPSSFFSSGCPLLPSPACWEGEVAHPLTTSQVQKQDPEIHCTAKHCEGKSLSWTNWQVSPNGSLRNSGLQELRIVQTCEFQWQKRMDNTSERCCGTVRNCSHPSGPESLLTLQYWCESLPYQELIWATLSAHLHKKSHFKCSEPLTPACCPV